MTSQPIQPRFTTRSPAGDTSTREVCDHCGFVDYRNPKIVVGSVVTHEGRYLLCRRAIEPRYGFWTVPAGYLELGETPEEGARREAREEATADLSIAGLMAVYTVRHLSQVQLIFRAELVGGQFAPGEESLECALFAFGEIPWDELAFPTVRWMLEHHHALGDGPINNPATNPDGAADPEI